MLIRWQSASQTLSAPWRCKLNKAPVKDSTTEQAIAFSRLHHRGSAAATPETLATLAASLTTMLIQTKACARKQISRTRSPFSKSIRSPWGKPASTAAESSHLDRHEQGGIPPAHGKHRRGPFAVGARGGPAARAVSAHTILPVFITITC
jgi:hypothetical protein